MKYLIFEYPKFRIIQILILGFTTVFLANCNYPKSEATELSQAIKKEQPTDTNVAFGFNTGRETLTTYGDSVVSLSPGLLRKTGILWAEIEPVEGQRNWDSLAELENELILGHNLGFEFILIVSSTPEWAQSIQGKRCGPIKEEKISSFARFMHDIVSRYSAPPFNVRYWEIWNEPDIAHGLVSPNAFFGCWGDQDDPFYGGGYYADMLKTIYPQIKEVDRKANVLIGGLLIDCDPRNPPELSPGSDQLKDCRSAKFLEGILTKNGGNYFDGISFHAYDYYYGELGKYGNPNWHSSYQTPGPVLFQKAAYINELLTKYNVANKSLFNTEVALICGASGQEDYCLTSDFQITKAAYITQSFLSAMSISLESNIWHDLTGWRGSGLITQNSEAELAFYAYQTAVQELITAEYIEEITHFPNLRGHSLRRDNTSIWVLWSVESDPHTVELPSKPTQVRDNFGGLLEPTKTLEISILPTYIYWENNPSDK